MTTRQKIGKFLFYPILGAILMLLFLKCNPTFIFKCEDLCDVKSKTEYVYIPGKDSIHIDTLYIDKFVYEKAELIDSKNDTNTFKFVVNDSLLKGDIFTTTDGTFVYNKFNYSLFIPTVFRTDTIKITKENTIFLKKVNVFKVGAEVGGNPNLFSYSALIQLQTKNNHSVGMRYEIPTKSMYVNYAIPIFTTK